MSIWKKQEAPQCSDSHLAELVRVKTVSEDIVRTWMRQDTGLCSRDRFPLYVGAWGFTLEKKRS